MLGTKRGSHIADARTVRIRRSFTQTLPIAPRRPFHAIMRSKLPSSEFLHYTESIPEDWRIVSRRYSCTDFSDDHNLAY